MKKTNGKRETRKGHRPEGHRPESHRPESLVQSISTISRSQGPQPSVRKPSHIPLFAEEHARLHAAARAVGLPYATWARATLLVVASWPVEQQPIRVGAIQVVLGKQTEISDEEIRRLVGVGFNIEHKETNS